MTSVYDDWYSGIDASIRYNCLSRTTETLSVGGVAQLVRTSVYDWRTFPGLRHDVQLTGDLFRVNRPLYVSQHGQLSHSSSWGL